MARYTGPSWKQSRRLKFSILETGKELQKRPYAPGQHGQRRAKISEYGLQLQEKQKVRFYYGVNEKQFRNLFEKAAKIPGKQGDNFLFLLASERLSELPTAPGTYTLVVDFSTIRGGTYPMEDYMSFYAYMGEEKTVMRVFFSLELPPAESESAGVGDAVTEPET